jgi:hypothetical protein
VIRRALLGAPYPFGPAILPEGDTGPGVQSNYP